MFPGFVPRLCLALLALLSATACRRPGERWLRDALAAGGRIALPAEPIEISAEIAIPAGTRDLELGGAGAVLRASPAFRGRALLSLQDATRVRIHDLHIDASAARRDPAGLPPSDVPFARFTRTSGLLIENSSQISLDRVSFQGIPGFAVLAASSRNVALDGVRVTASGSRNPAGRNNTTGGVLFEEGTSDFTVQNSVFRDILGNGVWTHSLYTSPRNARGVIARNRFERIGRDAIQIGHATEVRVERNTGREIGFPPEAVDLEGKAFPVAIDTAGNVDRSVYLDNRFEEINGKCIDLDGFHHGAVRGNVCVNRLPPQAFPNGNYGIVMNNTNPDMQSEGILIEDNLIDGPHFGGIFAIGAGHLIARNRLLHLNRARCNDGAAQFGCYYPPGEPDMLRSGIYLGRGAERPAPARSIRIEDNEISGYGMLQRCLAAAPGVDLRANPVRGNRCASDPP